MLEHLKQTYRRNIKEHKSECQLWWRCTTCFKVLDSTKRNPAKHKCSEWFCNTCKNYQYEPQHLCYQRAKKTSNSGRFKYIFFDYEASQSDIASCTEGYSPSGDRCQYCADTEDPCIKCRKCLNCKEASCGAEEHKPNFLVAQTACEQCQFLPITEKCEGYGSRCRRCRTKKKDGQYKHQLCEGCGYRQVTFRGPDTNDKFCKWAFHEDHKGATVFAHNMKGYDGYFLMQFFLNNGITLSNIVYNSAKIMSMQIGNGLNIRVLDSLNFLPMPLAALPAAFGLKELKKGYFPHFFTQGKTKTM